MSLVTGGAGFMGSHVADHLLAKGHNVVVLDDLSGGFRENVPAGATFVEGSITDHELIDRLFDRHSFDYVYHLAAYAAEGLSHFIKRFNYNNNLIGSVNLVNASINHEVKCFVFTSSIAVYGAGQSPMSEEMIPVPEDSYGISKLAVEQELRVSHEMFGLDYVIFRPHNVYGERQNIGDRYRNVVGIFMNQLLRGEPMTIFGDGMQQRAFTHIDDVAPIIAASVDFPSGAQSDLQCGRRHSPHGELPRRSGGRGHGEALRGQPSRSPQRGQDRIFRSLQGGKGVWQTRQDLSGGRHQRHGRMGASARGARKLHFRRHRSCQKHAAKLGSRRLGESVVRSKAIDHDQHANSDAKQAIRSHHSRAG